MFKIRSVSGAPPQTLWGSLRRPLVVRGFLPSAIVALSLRRLKFPQPTCLYVKNLKITPYPESTPRRLQNIDFFTSDMSHYLKVLKICPAYLCLSRCVFSCV